MKRKFGVFFCLWLALTANAEEKLRVIDLGSDEPVSAEAAERGRKYTEAQEAAAKITPDEAMQFMQRLSETVDKGHAQAKTGAMDGKAIRNQAIALNNLQEEGARYRVMFARFKSCGDASSDAAFSWQGLIGSNTAQFVEYHQKYIAAATECIQAAQVAASKG
ncbi:hypothetical protein NJH24_22350 [Pseudomonas asiatica]|uniref:hypothetical protein n=1 Tax=Pseudomonas TaxID=286 RepID=UPI000A1E839C|nr:MULTISPECIES: hypothetical protein [Pseudomonas]MCO7537507.1 hypothetical protein [Pseudomonas asiatica]MCO7551285.1 hypothetical protein [Pseudomonas asiatica]MCO7561871.1 hypothetical protein [Pseudomonas asiatica]